jgi:anaerobic selenocysteine-containing dehydrogenase
MKITRVSRPAWPGADGTLAMGLIHKIVIQDLVDHDYVGECTVGLVDVAE